MLQATLEALSAVQSGRPKSDDHRQAIAAAQRRRHAACRVLRAIEEVQEPHAAVLHVDMMWCHVWQVTPTSCP